MGIATNLVWLRTTCAQNGLPLSDEQLTKLDAFASHLLEWNKKINLISRRDEENILSVHILHSLSVLFKLDLPHAVRILDLGTGGGLPGIPLKIVRPDLSITLLDSTQKKTNVVRDIVNTLNLMDVEVIWGRAEELGRREGYKHAFGIVLARAVASLKDLLRWSFPLLKRPQGKRPPTEEPALSGKKRIETPTLIAFKGGALDGEIRPIENDPRVKTIFPIDLTLVGSNQFEVGEKKIVLVEINDRN